MNEPKGPMAEVDAATLKGAAKVGWATTSDGLHYRLTPAEIDSLMADIEAADAKRKADYPGEQDALNGMHQAFQRLKELGWTEAIYCPKDGTEFDAIEAGSTGIHRCHYQGVWPKGSWWVADAGDLWPSHPILFRLRATPTPTSRTDSEQAQASPTVCGEGR